MCVFAIPRGADIFRKVYYGRVATVSTLYNRLVDFTFDKPEHDALRRAYAEGTVVVSSGPYHHALLAGKGNLILLSDPEALRQLGANEVDIAALITVPCAQAVTPENALQLWSER